MPPRRHGPLVGSTLALLIVALVLLLGATNPSPAAYVAWATARLAPRVAFLPFRGPAYLAVEQATVAEDYGVCTVYRTRLDTANMTVLGILGQFVTIGGQRSPAPAPAPGSTLRRRPGSRHSLQI